MVKEETKSYLDQGAAKRIIELKSILKEELTRICELIGNANHLPMWVWILLLNSREMSLLEFELQKKMHEIYSNIELLNISNDRVHAMDDARIKEPTYDRMKAYNQDLEIIVKDKISDLLQSELLTT